MKSKTVTFLLCYSIGFLGAHRFYNRKIVSAILMLITLGGVGIWVIIDLILILTGRFKDRDGNALRTTPANSDRVEAGFWVRIAAISADNLLCTVVIFAIAVPLVFILGGGSLDEANPQIAFINLLFPIMVIVYFVILTASRRQATIGKRAFGIYVATTDGERIGYGRSFARLVCYVISAIPFYVGFLVAAFHPQKRALHDLIAGTVVLHGTPHVGEAVAATPAPAATASPAPAEALPASDFTAQELESGSSGRKPMLMIGFGVLLLILAAALQVLGLA